MRFTKYQKADTVSMTDGHTYQKGQMCRTTYHATKQTFLHYLAGYKNGLAVWVLVGSGELKKAQKANKRPSVERNAFGAHRIKAKETRRMASRPLISNNYRMSNRRYA